MGFQTDPGTLEPRPTDYITYIRYPPGLEGSISILRVPRYYTYISYCVHAFLDSCPAVWGVELTGGRQTLVPF